MGPYRTTTKTSKSCTSRTRYGSAHQHPNIGSVNWHPKNQHFQWRHVAPGKTEVSYEQWSHEVQCVKDHYPESVVCESIMQSLKGAAADMAHYMGPTAGVYDILEKLSVIFGTVASFDVLMQNFYKISQGNEKGAFLCNSVRGHLKSNPN